MKFSRRVALLAVLGFGAAAGLVRAETIELVTYYPASASAGDLHVNSITVGSAYSAVALDDGEAIIRTSLGIGPGFDTVTAAGLLHVMGEDNAASNVIFAPGAGTGTIRVGIGTIAPTNLLEVVGANDAAEIVSFTPGADTGAGGTPSIRVGIGTNNPSANSVLELVSTTAGFLPPRMTSAEREAIAGPTAGLQVFDTTANAMMVYNGTRWQEVGAVPIGTIQAWHKSLNGTPALPWGWQECNGQTLADAASPYNGRALPNLNGVTVGGVTPPRRFLRGGVVAGGIVTSGTIEADTLQDHKHMVPLAASSGVIRYRVPDEFGAVSAEPGASFSGAALTSFFPGAPQNTSDTYSLTSHVCTTTGLSGETRPDNMSVVWIIRVK